MSAEAADPGLLGQTVRLGDLVGMDPELGIGSGVCDVLAHVAAAVSGIDAEGEHLRLAELQKPGQNRNVVQVEDHAAFQSLTDVVVRKEIAAEHHFFAGEPDALGQKDLVDAGAVGSRALLTHDVHDGGIVAALHGIEHLEIGIILAEGAEGPAVVGADLLLVVHVQRSAEAVCQFTDGDPAHGNSVLFDFHRSAFLFVKSVNRWNSNLLPFFLFVKYVSGYFPLLRYICFLRIYCK